MNSNGDGETVDDVASLREELARLSRAFGSDPEYVRAGGGNSSVKARGILYVKPSGTPLAEATAEGMVALRLETLRQLAIAGAGGDSPLETDGFGEAVRAARTDPDEARRPSVEAALHALLPRRFVVHTHPPMANALTCSTSGSTICRELFGDDVLWVPYADPGSRLAAAVARALRGYTEHTGRDCPRGLLLQNHGIFIGGETAEEVRDTTSWIMSALRHQVGTPDLLSGADSTGGLEPGEVRRLINTLSPVLRGLLATSARLKVVTFSGGDNARALAGSAIGRELVSGGPVTPDQIVYSGSFPLWLDLPDGVSTAEILDHVGSRIAEHRAETGAQPIIVVVKGLGLFAIGDDYLQANTARQVYEDAISTMIGARQVGGIRWLDDREREFIEQWEAESYRRDVAARASADGRLCGLVALITGAAQGFGLEIALALHGEGAHVVLADVNVEQTRVAAAHLVGDRDDGRAIVLPIDVSDDASVAECLHQVVRRYGGLDLLVANAGILRAGRVTEQPLEEFDAVTAVNYRGYFLCVRHAAPILALQHRAKPDYRSDIVQVNSKSGLVGSSRNSAYAGSKFGAIGLTQSLALELVDDGIKVNAICPGNYLDGPLWSDPERGLFAQYLRAGKVPGALTIDDVRRHYESQVPMGRGCTPADVVAALIYLVQQQYETGQVIPVTGGQVMLR